MQDAIQNWGKLTLVYRPSEADIIILVTSRPSEDVLAVYDVHGGPRGNYLWRVMGRNGLQSGETPLVTQFEKGFESVQNAQVRPARATAPEAEVEASEPRTAYVADRSNLVLCNQCRPRLSPSWHDSLGIWSWRQDNSRDNNSSHKRN